MCPACGQLGKSRVTKSLETKAFNQRWRECECRAQWLTEEVTVKGSLKAISDLSLGHICSTSRSPLTQGILRSGSDLPVLESNPDPERARVSATRRKKRYLEYPPDFEAFWSACESNRSKGLKGEALEAWIEAGRPDCVMLLDKWRQYRAAQGETLCKDVCRWIKWGGHLDEYRPAPLPPRPFGGGRTSNNVAVAVDFMKRKGIL